MLMIQDQAFKKAIRHNCDISDASGAAIFSICGMALRLRDLNKWEMNLDAWDENNPADLVGWIDKKEQLWETLDGKEFSPLPLSGNNYDPFDTTGINAHLSSQGLFYGAGYAHSLKPAFLLARIDEVRKINNIQVFMLGRELVRDLFNTPALNQDGAVLIRRDAARFFLWDQMAYLKKSGQPYLKMALRNCGLPDTRRQTRKKWFSSILSAQEETYIYHEIGEITDTGFDHDTFRKIVALFPHTPVELLARTLKDLLADTGDSGPIARMISKRHTAGLAFYAAFQDGLFRPLFPQFRPAVSRFESDGNWDEIEQTRRTGYKTAQRYVTTLLDLYEDTRYRNNPDRFSDKINTTVIEPLLNG